MHLILVVNFSTCFNIFHYITSNLNYVNTNKLNFEVIILRTSVHIIYSVLPQLFFSRKSYYCALFFQLYVDTLSSHPSFFFVFYRFPNKCCFCFLCLQYVLFGIPFYHFVSLTPLKIDFIIFISQISESDYLFFPKFKVTFISELKFVL